MYAPSTDGAADLRELGRVPSVGAQQDGLQPQRACLPRDESRVRVVAGHEEHVGLLRADGRELRGEVAVALRVLQLVHDPAAGLAEHRREGLGETDGVVAADVDEHRRRRGVEVAAREAGEGASLVGVDVARAEDVVALLRDLDVRRRRRDHGHAVGLRDGRRGERSRRSLLADQGDDVVARDQLGHHRRRLRRLSPVVLGEHVDRPAEHATRRVDLVGREIDAVASRLREGRGRTGQRAVEPDRDALRLRRLFAAARRAERGGDGEGNEKARAHGGRIIGVAPVEARLKE